MKFNASSAANGVGESVGEFSPSGSSGSTGGQGFRNGSLNVSGATSQSSLSSVGTLVGSTLSVMAMIVGGGAAFGFNSFGEAGGLGSASTTGSATGSLGTDLGDSNGNGNGAVIGNFNTAGSGSFWHAF